MNQQRQYCVYCGFFFFEVRFGLIAQSLFQDVRIGIGKGHSSTLTPSRSVEMFVGSLHRTNSRALRFGLQLSPSWTLAVDTRNQNEKGSQNGGAREARISPAREIREPE